MVSSRYKTLSLIQTAFIILTALSVFDLGYSGSVEKGIWFNHVLFHLDKLPDFVKDSPFWGEFQFWGYSFAIVAICQILKVVPIEAFHPRKIGCFSGASAAGILIISTMGAIVVSLPDYNSATETLSSLVDYGWLPTILLSWGQMLGALLAIPFFLHLAMVRRPAKLSLLASLIGCFSCVMLFITGLLLPTDEPWNHGISAYAFFVSMALAIGLFAFTFAKAPPIEQALRISGWVICPMVFLLIIITPWSLVPIIQKFVVLSYLLWLVGLGMTTCERAL
ncbi:MAG: hypothetical protein ACFFB3_23260 [Candidatus Hodarchaeota archaeon]